LVGFLGWGIGPSQDLCSYRGQHNTEKYEHTSKPPVEFKPIVKDHKHLRSCSIDVKIPPILHTPSFVTLITLFFHLEIE
jgi:hypothetical protein